MSNLGPALYNASPTLGAYSIGLQLSLVLLGILTMQTYIYFFRYPNDQILIKALVAVIWFLEVAHAICIADTGYFWTITHYGDPSFIAKKPPVGLQVSVIMSAMVFSITQAFFAWRLLTISRKFFLALIIWCLCFVRFTAALALVIIAQFVPTLPQLLEKCGWIFLMIFAVGTVTDIFVAVCICYYMNRQRGQAMRRTARIITKLMAYSIQTGIVTSLTEIATFITFATVTDTFIWLGMFTLLSRLFSNSLLASLNARTFLRDHQSNVHTTMEFSTHHSMRFGAINNANGISNTRILPKHEVTGESRDSDGTTIILSQMNSKKDHDRLEVETFDNGKHIDA